jgi:hypothetical protein
MPGTDGTPRCQFCHRALKSPASIARGIGSTCWEKLGGSTKLRDRAQRKRNKAKAKLLTQQVEDEGQMEFQWVKEG